jgi:hypothetical protein
MSTAPVPKVCAYHLFQGICKVVFHDEWAIASDLGVHHSTFCSEIRDRYEETPSKSYSTFECKVKSGCVTSVEKAKSWWEGAKRHVKIEKAYFPQKPKVKDSKVVHEDPKAEDPKDPKSAELVIDGKTYSVSAEKLAIIMSVINSV